MLGQVGPILGLSWAEVGPMLPYVGSMLALLAYLGPCWPCLGPMLAHVGPMLAHLGVYVEARFAVCEIISIERPPRCQFFLPGPLRGRKNHVKTTFFLTFASQKIGIGRGYETP